MALGGGQLGVSELVLRGFDPEPVPDYRSHGAPERVRCHPLQILVRCERLPQR